MIFVFHLTLQDHIMKLLNDFMVRSPSKFVTILPSLVTKDTVVVEIN